MRGYPKQRKEAILAKMTGPDRKSVPALAVEEGISEATLYNWRNEARGKGELMPDFDDAPEGWSSQDKFNAVLETAALSEHELSEYCRSKGLYVEQLRRWREACEQANDWDRSQKVQLAKKSREDKQRIDSLQRELKRKDSALAETAAILALRKKAEAIWGEEER